MYREQYGGYVDGYSSVKCWSVWPCMKMNQSSSSWWDNLQSNLSNVSKFLTGLPPCVPQGGREGRQVMRINKKVNEGIISCSNT